MKIIGLIAEYNPLHNGHVYHYNKIKELYKDSLVITILSSEFSERGELCVFNKFIRSNESLKLGSDLVLSNPIYYSMNNASTFAYSNIYFLNKCHVDTIVAGSESCDISMLEKIYVLENTKEFKDILNYYLSNGYSFKLSYTKTLEKYNLNFKSNDLLNYFYFKAIKEINPKIKLEFIKRINNDYNDTIIKDGFIQSATTIRKLSNIKDFVPDFVNLDFTKYGFRDINKMVDIIKYSLLNPNNSNRENIEGLANRFSSLNFNTYDELVELVSTKRYSKSKINRFIISNMLNLDSEIIYYDFIRVIGFNKKGKELLNKIKFETNIYTSIKESINKVFDYEILLDKILDIVYKENLVKKDISSPIIID